MRTLSSVIAFMVLFFTLIFNPILANAEDSSESIDTSYPITLLDEYGKKSINNVHIRLLINEEEETVYLDLETEDYNKTKWTKSEQNIPLYQRFTNINHSFTRLFLLKPSSVETKDIKQSAYVIPDYKSVDLSPLEESFSSLLVMKAGEKLIDWATDSSGIPFAGDFLDTFIEYSVKKAEREYEEVFEEINDNYTAERIPSFPTKSIRYTETARHYEIKFDLSGLEEGKVVPMSFWLDLALGDPSNAPYGSPPNKYGKSDGILLNFSLKAVPKPQKESGFPKDRTFEAIKIDSDMMAIGGPHEVLNITYPITLLDEYGKKITNNVRIRLSINEEEETVYLDLETEGYNKTDWTKSEQNIPLYQRFTNINHSFTRLFLLKPSGVKTKDIKQSAYVIPDYKSVDLSPLEESFSSLLVMKAGEKLVDWATDSSGIPFAGDFLDTFIEYSVGKEEREYKEVFEEINGNYTAERIPSFPTKSIRYTETARHYEIKFDLSGLEEGKVVPMSFWLDLALGDPSNAPYGSPPNKYGKSDGILLNFSLNKSTILMDNMKGEWLVQFNIRNTDFNPSYCTATAIGYSIFHPSMGLPVLSEISGDRRYFMAYYNVEKTLDDGTKSYTIYDPVEEERNDLFSDIVENLGTFIGPFNTKLEADTWINNYSILKSKVKGSPDPIVFKDISAYFPWFSPIVIKIEKYGGALQSEQQLFEVTKKEYGTMKFVEIGRFSGLWAFETFDGKIIFEDYSEYNFSWSPRRVEFSDNDRGEDYILEYGNIIIKREGKVVSSNYSLLNKYPCIIEKPLNNNKIRVFEILKEGTKEQLKEAMNNIKLENISFKSGVTPLMVSAQYNINLDIITLLIKAGAQINVCDTFGLTPLMYAARYNLNKEVIATLLKAGADVNASDKEGITPLMYAEQYNKNNDIIYTLIKAGADVNASDKEGITPLMYMARYNKNIETISALLRFGADVNASDKEGITPLMYAEKYNKNNDIIYTLIKAGADVNASDKEGMTPLMYMARYNANIDALTVLINSGSIVNICDKNGKTPLLYLLKNIVNNDMVLLFLKAGAKVNQCDNYGRTPLMYASQDNGNVDIIKTLLNAGAKVNQCDNYGTTALLYASRYNGNVDIIKTLLNAGANVNASQSNGITSLVFAVQSYSNIDIVTALLEAGADVNIRYGIGNTILLDALEKNDTEIALSIFKYGAVVNACNIQEGISPLMIAALHAKNPEIISLFLKAGANVNSIDKKGMTPLMYAARNNENPEIVSLLINAGANVNAIDIEGKASLMYATRYNMNSDAIIALLKANAKVNIYDESGNTPLMYAAGYHNNVEVIKSLLNAGAYVNVSDKFGKNPLLYALEIGNLNIVLSLINAGANVNVCDKSGNTPLMYAAGHHKNVEVIKALLKAGADVNASDTNGSTSLLYAIENPNYSLDIILELLKAGSDVNVIDKDGMTPLMYAEKNNLTQEVISELVKAGADVNIRDKEGMPLLMCILRDNDNVEVITTFINAEVNVNVCDESGITPLMYAAGYHKNVEVIKALLKAGADVNASDTNGSTSLLYAIENSNYSLDIILELLKAGSDVNVIDKDGMTPLMYAEKNNLTQEVISELVKAGADVNIRNKEGVSALMYAIKYQNNQDIIEALTNAGSDVNATDKNGMTPLLYAARFNENKNLITILLKAGADINANDNEGMTSLMYAVLNISEKPDFILALINSGADCSIRSKAGIIASEYFEYNKNVIDMSVYQHLKKNSGGVVFEIKKSGDGQYDDYDGYRDYLRIDIIKNNRVLKSLDIGLGWQERIYACISIDNKKLYYINDNTGASPSNYPLYYYDIENDKKEVVYYARSIYGIYVRDIFKDSIIISRLDETSSNPGDEKFYMIDFFEGGYTEDKIGNSSDLEWFIYKHGNGFISTAKK